MAIIEKKGKVNFNIPIEKLPSTIKVSADCGKIYPKVENSYPLNFENCPRIKFEGKIDGDLSKWAGHPYIAMNKRIQIYPPDKIDWSGPEQFSAKKTLNLKNLLLLLKIVYAELSMRLVTLF